MLYYNHSKGKAKQCFTTDDQKRLIETPKGIEPQEIAAPTNQQEDNTIGINEMERKVRELRELQALIEEATAEAEALKDAIKAAMGDAESVQAGEYRITYKAVTTARIDTAALKKALPDLAQQFTKTTTARRFCVA